MRISLDATERKVLAVGCFVSACIAYAPQEIVSGSVLLLMAFGLAFWDYRATKRERAASAAPPPAPAAPAPEA